MSWWGMLVGGTLGLVVGGPIGALLGAALGHSAGRVLRGASPVHGDLSGTRRERTQAAFFAATFGVMGQVANADGHVGPDEIRLANQVMDELGLDTEQRRAARALFDEGKAHRFPLDEVLDQLRAQCGRASNLLRLFLEIQVNAAWADGRVHGDERRLLRHVATRLGFPESAYFAIEAMIGAGSASPTTEASSGPSLEDAYATLAVAPDAPDEDVRRAYRRAMSRHHPDKLAAKGLPEEMLRAATRRTQQIAAAWDRVRADRSASGVKAPTPRRTS